LGVMFLTAVCSVIGFLLVVQQGIVAVAAAFVMVGYLLAPISYIAVRKLIQIDLRTYLWQFAPSLSASLIMVAVLLGLKYLFKDQSLNLYLELCMYVLAGVLTYALVIGLTARSLFGQVLELVRLGLPGSKLRKKGDILQ